MSNLELEKKKVELMRVQTAKAELNLKILEKLSEVERLKEHIDIQDKKEQELKKELKQEGI